MKTNPKHVGSDFKDYLAERLKDKKSAKRYERIRLNIALGQMIKRIAREKKLTIRSLAKRMNSSISLVQRLLNDQNVTVNTLAKFAAVTGKNLQITIK